MLVMFFAEESESIAVQEARATPCRFSVLTYIGYTLLLFL